MSARPYRNPWRIVVLLIPVLTLAALIAAALIDRAQDTRAAAAFARIDPGTREDQVRAWLGGPDAEQACPEQLFWGDPPRPLGANAGRCVREASYDYFDDSWLIGYSADGRVVSKVHRRSK